MVGGQETRRVAGVAQPAGVHGWASNFLTGIVFLGWWCVQVVESKGDAYSLAASQAHSKRAAWKLGLLPRGDFADLVAPSVN